MQLSIGFVVMFVLISYGRNPVQNGLLNGVLTIAMFAGMLGGAFFL